MSSSRTPAWARDLIARMDHLEATLAESAPAQPAAQSPAAEPRIAECECGATFRFGRTAADIAQAGSLCAAKGRTTHRNGGAPA